MKQYLDLINDVLKNGDERGDRTGTGTLGVFGRQLRFDLTEGFPLVTTKKLHIRSIIHELLWFISGDTNIKYLKENNVKIWDEWADVNGDLGPVYGKQWRSWENPDGGKVDQVEMLIDTLKNNPTSRRHIISAWNVSDVSSMALPPCHLLQQYYVSGGKLSCQLYQRSADIFLGVPFNIASYALFTHMIAQQCNLEPGEFVWTGGDVHLYQNHIEQAKIQVKRKPQSLPKLEIRRLPPTIFDYGYDDFEITGYDPHPHIPAPVAV